MKKIKDLYKLKWTQDGEKKTELMRADFLEKWLNDGSYMQIKKHS